MLRWPVFAELNPYLEDGAVETRPAMRVIAPPPRIDSEDWADKVMRGPFGPEAIDRGVAVYLWEWAEQNPGRYPSGELLNGFAESLAERKDWLANIRRKETVSPLETSLLRVAEHAEKRSAELASKYAANRPTLDTPNTILGAG